MVCDRIFLELIGGNDPDKLDSLLTKEQKKLMKASEASPSVLRTEYAYALLAEHDTEKAQKLEEKFEQIGPDYPYSGEFSGEQEFMQIIRAHADRKENEKRT